ncbi:MAG: 50S ribosomal protein L16 [Patescibacteria group bacterium]|nr:50S ribosomal protein L16 [Patescibacteria group bacterium]
MLMPKKTKHRKWQRGRSKKRLTETRGLTVAYGSFGLKAMSPAWMDGRQLEAARKTITNFLKREGKVWIRVFPDKPITKKPPEVTLGGGKGDVDKYVVVIKPGRVLFEVDGVPKETAVQALKMASYKLPVKTKIVFK